MKPLLGLLCLIAIVLSAPHCFCADVPSSKDVALRQLDGAVLRNEQYLKARQKRIDSLTRASDGSAAALLAIGDAYRKFSVDSALHYYYLAQTADDGADAMRARLRFSSLLPVSGNLADAISSFEAIAPDELPAELKADYHEAGNQLYFYASTISPSRERKNRYAAIGRRHTDALLALTPADSDDYLLYSAERHLLSGDDAQALADLTELISRVPLGDPHLALAATMMAYHWADGEHRPQEETYLALAAVSDLVSGTREMTALQTLGRMLYDDGDTDRAFRYLNLALDITLDSGSRMRIMDAASAMPDITQTIHRKLEERNAVLLALVCLLAAMIAAIGVLMWKMYTSHRKLDESADRLKVSLADRELHIRHVLALCSECIDRLEDYNLIAGRKIKAKQVTELYEMVQSRKILHDQHQKFLCTFDETFLSMYPNFIAELNALLQPDKQVALPSARTLSPELRIMAMMRLGIDDAQAISKILDLSVNTVYTYRNKMKNRAISRDDFEEKLRAKG